MIDLVAWRDAAVRGTLPGPGRADRWQPLRAGIVNLWEYDTAEVWYADGRLQLQGANESGKSTLMTLITLLLLAGDISGHNVDTLGQSGKRFRYYVEPTTHPMDRRDAGQQKNRGWAWAEYGRSGPQGAEFFTIMLFAEARRADTALRLQWCTAHGAARVRDGLTLAKAGLITEPGQLRDTPEFTIHRSGTAYREEIARTLFDSDIGWLDQIVRILRVVRTPKIGDRLDLNFLTEAFRAALPPIADDEVNQLADGWEQLERLRNERDTTEQALAAVTDFTRHRWRPWADAVIRSAADPVVSATSTLTKITRDESQASQQVTGLRTELTNLDEKIAKEEERIRHADAEREGLKGSRAYQDAVSAAANAQQLAEQARHAEELATRSEQRAASAKKAIQPAELHVRDAMTHLAAAEDEVAMASAKVTDHAADAGLTEPTARHLGTRDIARLHQAGEQRMGAAERAITLIDEHGRAVTAADIAAERALTARTALENARRDMAQAERTLEASITAVGELLDEWSQRLDERIRPERARVESWTRLVSGIAESARPAPVLAAAVHRGHLDPARRRLDLRFAELTRALTDNAAAREQAREELDQIEAERDPHPRDPELWQRRPRPDGVTSTGAPLWRLVEIRADDAAAGTGQVPNDTLAGLEATLEAAGLLQAWVTEDGAYLAGRDGHDTVWTATGATEVAAEHSLRSMLRPADDAGPFAPVVDRLLGTVAYGATIPDGQVAIGTDGRWRYGGLTGTAAASPLGPRLLGAAARAADRARRIVQLKERLTVLEEAAERLAAEIKDVTDSLEAIDAASTALPGDGDVVSAVLRLRQTEHDAGKAAYALEQAETAERQARARADTAAAEVAAHAVEHDLPRTREEIDAVRRAVTEYATAVQRLAATLGLLPSLRTAAEQAEKALATCREAYEQAVGDAQTDNTTALKLRAKADAAQAALSQETQEIIVKVEALGRQIDERKVTLDRLADEHGALTESRLEAEMRLRQVAERRADAERERQVAVDGWFACLDSGLARLRGLADPAARHVTGALESARTARARIGVRDWPDAPSAVAHRVQSLWARMVEAAALLRSRLESLAGRTVRTISPGEGVESFPGAVEIIVDGTGAALPPPTALDTLSALLLRLQTDYDEELTKTINELLGSTFIEHLRDRLSEAERLRSDINLKLAQNPTTTSGLTLRLVRLPVSEERQANEVLGALERDFGLLPETAQDQIRRFLSRRVSDAQEAARAAGDPDWRSRLATVLDYRRWFELQLEYRTPRSAAGDNGAGGWRRLNRDDHSLLSGGAKVVTLLQPFVAALHAMYDQSGVGPRMMWLDEAFDGVDPDNRTTMLRLLTSCDLDWLIAGPGVIANTTTVPMAAIYEVRRAPRPFPGVALELMVWAGGELTHVATPDPADLPDLTAAEPATPGDDLFSTLTT